MTTILGIDEAGRGSVIGPLVIAGCMVEEKDLAKLKALGVKDSKLILPKNREPMEKKIKALVKDFVVLKVSAREIDETRKRINLNLIEAEKMAEIIRILKADLAYVDAPQVSTDKFRNVLLNMAKNDTKIIAENKADVTYPIVSAASILAKVERDREIELIKKKVGVNFGVGYPHDERSIDFVKQCLRSKKHLKYIRHSWITTIELKKENEQRTL